MTVIIPVTCVWREEPNTNLAADQQFTKVRFEIEPNDQFLGGVIAVQFRDSFAQAYFQKGKHYDMDFSLAKPKS